MMPERISGVEYKMGLAWQSNGVVGLMLLPHPLGHWGSPRGLLSADLLQVGKAGVLDVWLHGGSRQREVSQLV